MMKRSTPSSTKDERIGKRSDPLLSVRSSRQDRRLRKNDSVLFSELRSELKSTKTIASFFDGARQEERRLRSSAGAINSKQAPALQHQREEHHDEVTAGISVQEARRCHDVTIDPFKMFHATASAFKRRLPAALATSSQVLEQQQKSLIRGISLHKEQQQQQGGHGCEGRILEDPPFSTGVGSPTNLQQCLRLFQKRKHSSSLTSSSCSTTTDAENILEPSLTPGHHHHRRRLPLGSRRTKHHHQIQNKLAKSSAAVTPSPNPEVAGSARGAKKRKLETANSPVFMLNQVVSTRHHSEGDLSFRSDKLLSTTDTEGLVCHPPVTCHQLKKDSLHPESRGKKLKKESLFRKTLDDTHAMVHRSIDGAPPVMISFPKDTTTYVIDDLDGGLTSDDETHVCDGYKGPHGGLLVCDSSSFNEDNGNDNEGS